MTSYYDLLGVGVDADLDEVRRAYHRKAQLLHPDRYAVSPDEERRRAETEMKAANAAWNTLKNPEARRRYDAALGLTDGDHEEESLAAGEPWEEAEEYRRGTGFSRKGVRFAVAFVVIVSIVASVFAAVSLPDDQAPRWSASAIAELRFAALNAGLSAPQAECFVEAITARYGPTEPVDRAVAQQVLASCY
jgi:curved DNA-binding protein CbpA